MSHTRLLRFLLQLNECGPVNAYAIAFILTESRFRGPLHRLCELVYAVVVLDLFRKNPKVTLGKCQVGLVHWQNAFGASTSVLVRAVLSDVCNYNVCCAYLNDRRWSSLREAAIQYNGKPSLLYVRLLQANLSVVTSAMKRLNVSSL